MVEHDERITRSAHEHRFGSLDVLGGGTISVLESKKEVDNGKRRAGRCCVLNSGSAQQTDAYLGAEAYIWKAAFRVAIGIGGAMRRPSAHRHSTALFMDILWSSIIITLITVVMR